MKKYFLCFSASLLLCFIYKSSNAQLKTLSDSTNQFMISKIRSADTTGFITWKCDSIEPNTVNSTLKSYIGLGTFDTLIMVDSVLDSILFMVKNKYHQFHKGILVENAVYVEHIYNGSLLLSNGLIVEGLGDRDTSPDITESFALSIALAELECDTFYWEDDSLEYYHRLDSLEGDTTWYPQGELIFANLDSPYYSMDPLQWKLAWVFEIKSKVPLSTYLVYVDALLGDVIKIRNPVSLGNFDSPIYGNGLYIDTKLNDGRHYLWGNDGGKNIKTKRAHIGNSHRYSSLRSDSDGDFESDFPIETQTHYVINQAYSYWNERFKRKGTDGKNRELRITVFDHNDNDKETQYYGKPKLGRPEEISFSSMNGNAALDAVLDIAGHEYAHAVIQWESSLDNCKEPGAINEGLADIFGLGSEAHTRGGSYNWTIGEDANWILRDMQTPSNNSNPSVFKGTYYKNTDSAVVCGSNFGWAHSNSAVLSRWFYLLTEGGSNSGIGCFPVTGISFSKAEAIVHLTTIKFLSQKTGFAAMREATLKATRFLFGECSFEEVQVCRAWATINIGGCCECMGTASVPDCWPDLLPEGEPVPLKTISNLSADRIFVSPNPVYDVLNLEIQHKFDGALIEEYWISNIQGHIVDCSKVPNLSKTTINTSSLKSGIYFLTVRMNNSLISIKIIKNEK